MEPTRRTALWWLALIAIAVAGLVGRAWNLDFDDRQHQHPDERHWAMTSADLAALEREAPASGHGTVFGPVLDWLDADVSPANPYRVKESFVYGSAPLAWARGLASWMRDGVDHGTWPAGMVVDGLDALGVPLLHPDGTARFDAGYDVDLVGRVLGVAFDTITIVLVGLIGRRLAGRHTAGPAVGLVAAVLYAACPLMLQATHFLSSEPALALASAATLLAALRLDRSADRAAAARGGALLGACSGVAVAIKLSALPLVVVPLAGCVWLAWRHRRAADLVRLASAMLATGVAFRAFHPAAFEGLGLTLSERYRTDLQWSRDQFTIDWPPAYQWAGRSGIGQVLSWMLRFTLGPGLCLAAVAGAVVLVRRWRRGWLSGGSWSLAITFGAVIVPFVYVVVLAVPLGRYFVPTLPALAALGGLGVVGAWRAAGQVPTVWPARAVRGAAVALVLVGVLWGAMFVRGVYGPEYTRTAASQWLAAHAEPGSVLSHQLWDDRLPLAVDGVDPAAFDYEQLELVGTDSVDKLLRLVDQLDRIDYVVESSPRLWGTVGRLPARFPSTIQFFEGLDSGVLGFERVATFDGEPRLGPLRLADADAEEAFSVYDHPEVRIWHKVRDVPRADLIDALDPVAAATATAGDLQLTTTELDALDATGTWDSAFDRGPDWLHAVGWLIVLELLAGAAFVLLLPLLRRLPDAGWGIAKPLGLAAPTTALFVADEWLGIGVTRAAVVAAVTAFVVAGGWVAWARRAELRALWAERRRVLITVEEIALVAFAAMLALRAANPDLWHPAYGGEKPFELAFLSAVLRSPGWPPYDPWFSGGVMNYYYGGFLMLVAPARVWATNPALSLNLGLAVYAACTAAAAATVGAWLAGRARPIAGALAGTFVMIGTNLAVVPEAWRALSSSDDFDWWSVSRVVPGQYDITEFPAWSFLFADLHPHLMAQALVLTAVVWFSVVYRSVADKSRWPTLVAAGGVAGVLAGLIRATNTWDFPLVLGGAVASIALAGWWSREFRRAAVALASVAVGALVVWRPYVARGEVFDSGVVRATLHTPIASWLTQWAWFAIATVLALATRPPDRSWSTPRLLAGTALFAGGVLLLWPWSAVFVITAVLAAASLRAAWIQRHVAMALLGLGWSIQAGVELVTVRNDIDRMNTVFKFWFESWLLLAAGSAAVVVALAADRGWVRWPARALGAAAVAVAVVFQVLAVPARVDDRVSAGGWSLDGERYLTHPTDAAVTSWLGQPIRPADDLALAEWLRANAPGGSVVAEAAGDDYQWTSRMTWLTGLPSPSGWWFHSSQQRRAYAATVDARHVDLQALYTTADPAEVARILATYRIDYAVFGTVERVLAGPDSALADSPCLARQFTDWDLWVAAVDQGCAYDQWLAALVTRA